MAAVKTLIPCISHIKKNHPNYGAFYRPCLIFGTALHMAWAALPERIFSQKTSTSWARRKTKCDEQGRSLML